MRRMFYWHKFVSPFSNQSPTLASLMIAFHKLRIADFVRIIFRFSKISPIWLRHLHFGVRLYFEHLWNLDQRSCRDEVFIAIALKMLNKKMVTKYVSILWS